MILSLFKKHIFILSVIILFQGSILAGEAKDIELSIENMKKFTKGVYIGMGYEKAETILGKPRQKNVVENKEKSFVAVWDLKGYSLDASFNMEEKIHSFGIHWFGNPSTIPEYKSILSGEFLVKEKRRTTMVHLEGDDILLDWSKKPVPGMEDKMISVLTVSSKNKTGIHGN